jgi:hypothetical protein
MMSVADRHAASMYTRALLAAAFAYVVCHHVGLLPSGLGAAPRGTRWADWLDLAVPWLVLAPAAAALWAAQTRPQVWGIFGAGVAAYASGHGIHLAANSVGNTDPGPTAHLWDEHVGHYIWFAGVALVLMALALTMVGRRRAHPLGYVLAIAAGLTWATNAIGGGTVLFSLVIATAVVVFGIRHRSDLAGILCIGYLPAVVVLAAESLIRGSS